MFLCLAGRKSTLLFPTKPNLKSCSLVQMIPCISSSHTHTHTHTHTQSSSALFHIHHNDLSGYKSLLRSGIPKNGCFLTNWTWGYGRAPRGVRGEQWPAFHRERSGVTKGLDRLISRCTAAGVFLRRCKQRFVFRTEDQVVAMFHVSPSVFP